MIIGNVNHAGFELTESDIENYVTGKMTTIGIARSRGVSRWFLIRQLRKSGIKEVIDKLNEKIKRNYCDESQKSLAISRLKLGWKVDAIALETGLSNTTIRKIKRNMNTLDNRS